MDLDFSNVIYAVPQNTGSKYKEQNRDATVSPGEQEAKVTSDEYLDLGVCDQKPGNRWETSDFLEDGGKTTTKGINGRRDLWTPSPDRESKLEVVKTGLLYDVRAYKGEKKPSRLYEEDEGEFLYKLPPEDLTPEKAKELEEERREIIRSQAVKKSTTTAEKWSSTDNLGAGSPAVPHGEKDEPRRSDSMEFAVCFEKPPLGWVRTVVDPENIDTEQISFAVARRQFLALEKSNPNLLLGPRKGVVSPRLPVSKNVYESTHRGCPAILKGEDLGKVGCGLRTKGGQPWKESGATLDWVAGGQDCAKEPEEARDETPLEREIRLSVEREKDFWQERGIQRVNSRDELVEIHSKPLLSSLRSTTASSRKRKDKMCVSFNVQREIEQETKREEDLQKEGRLPGSYDKETLQEVGELRKVFEQDGAPPPPAQKPQRPEEVQESTPERSADLCFAHDQEKRTPWEMNQSSAASQSCSVLDTSLGDEPGQSQQGDSPGLTLLSPKEMVDPDAQVVLRKEHFATPARNSKRASVDEQGSPRGGRTEGRLKWEAPREELYTLKTGKTRTSLLIDREIQDALHREEELQQQRRKGQPATSRGTEKKSSGSHLQSPSSAAFVVDSSSPISSSPTSLPASPPLPSEPDSKTHQSSMQSPTEKEKKRRQREEGKYAGIEPTDEIDAEVVNSTKVVRRRGVRAQLWEAGQILKRGEESEEELPLFDF